MVDSLQETVPDKVWSLTDIIRAHRLGPQRTGASGYSANPRPMIAKFARWSDKMEVLAKGREKLREKGVKVAGDLTTRQKRIIKDHRDRGLHAHFKGDKLIVTGPINREPGSNTSHEDRRGGARVSQDNNGANSDSTTHFPALSVVTEPDETTTRSYLEEANDVVNTSNSNVNYTGCELTGAADDGAGEEPFLRDASTRKSTGESPSLPVLDTTNSGSVHGPGLQGKSSNVKPASRGGKRDSDLPPGQTHLPSAWGRGVSTPANRRQQSVMGRGQRDVTAGGRKTPTGPGRGLHVQGDSGASRGPNTRARTWSQSQHSKRVKDR